MCRNASLTGAASAPASSASAPASSTSAAGASSSWTAGGSGRSPSCCVDQPSGCVLQGFFSRGCSSGFVLQGFVRPRQPPRDPRKAHPPQLPGPPPPGQQPGAPGAPPPGLWTSLQGWLFRVGSPGLVPVFFRLGSPLGPGPRLGYPTIRNQPPEDGWRTKPGLVPQGLLSRVCPVKKLILNKK